MFQVDTIAKEEKKWKESTKPHKQHLMISCWMSMILNKMIKNAISIDINPIPGEGQEENGDIMPQMQSSKMRQPRILSKQEEKWIALAENFKK